MTAMTSMTMTRMLLANTRIREMMPITRIALRPKKKMVRDENIVKSCKRESGKVVKDDGELAPEVRKWRREEVEMGGVGNHE